jgi:NarL family two-component system response regulator LiaR
MIYSGVVVKGAVDMMKVLLVEDHEVVRHGTRVFLESEGIEVVGEATNGREAVALARELQPDVVIMDIHLPELTGVEATRRIHHENEHIRVLVLTAYNEPSYIRALLDAGADGFVLKTAELAQLLRALREVAIGRKAFATQALEKAAQHHDDLNTLAEGLTDREIQVLEQAGHGLTNKEIGSLLFISDRTVQGHLKNIYQKLGVTSRTEAVALALKYGLITLNEGEAP